MTGLEAERLEPGSYVFWNDPDEGECSREYEIEQIEHCGDMVRITEPDGSQLQCFVSELEQSVCDFQDCVLPNHHDSHEHCGVRSCG